MPDPALLPHAIPPQPLDPLEIHLWFCEFPRREPIEVRRQAQVFLLRLLSAYLLRRVDAAELEVGAHGKPALAAGGFDFNLSHSGGAAVVALGRGVEVGVDLESPGRPRPHAELARRYFCGPEAQSIGNTPEALRETAFLRLWTAKEAVLKALGRGLAFGLDKLEFDATVDPPALLRIDVAGGAAALWHLHALPLPSPWLGHLAWRGETRRVRSFHDATLRQPV
ncbi:4'-phosphopantetheinyl transferase superfamily protein [Tahibacter sp.]|uniref:4'-phosphopantetheinyl transferase family protein n=1 Tax=Tahibacter sp. TaxID=2056211 RepID=UPI0028C3F3A3|nr:4'-phosphopantetheinyl transferase superfamily protein [Tahibacter sp.]